MCFIRIRFSTQLTSHRICSMQLVWIDKWIQIMHVVISSINSGAYMNILIIIKVKILVLIQWSYTFPQSRRRINLKRSAYFEHVVQSLLNTCLFGCLFFASLTPKTTYHSNTIGKLLLCSIKARLPWFLLDLHQDLHQGYIANSMTDPLVNHNNEDLTKDKFEWKKINGLQLYTYCG